MRSPAHWIHFQKCSGYGVFFNLKGDFQRTGDFKKEHSLIFYSFTVPLSTPRLIPVMFFNLLLVVFGAVSIHGCIRAFLSNFPFTDKPWYKAKIEFIQPMFGELFVFLKFIFFLCFKKYQACSQAIFFRLRTLLLCFFVSSSDSFRQLGEVLVHVCCHCLRLVGLLHLLVLLPSPRVRLHPT